MLGLQNQTEHVLIFTKQALASFDHFDPHLRKLGESVPTALKFAASYQISRRLG